MSKVTLQIVAQVINNATKPLKDIESGLQKTGKAAQQAKINFVELNRALFSTKAFFGIFTGVFNNFKRDMTEAANLQRVEDSFKNTFGVNSDIITSLDKFSSIGVDRVEAMKNAISLGMMGVAKSSDQAAEILAGAAYGAKQAGVDTSEAMGKIVQGLKDGSLSGLEYLNTIRSADPALKAQLELLNKYSGSIGGAVTSQTKLNLILSITSRLSQLAKGNQEDLVDSIIKLDNAYNRLKQTIGTFLGKAFGGFLHSLTESISSVTNFININTQGDKGLIHLAKSLSVATVAATALYSSFYALKIISTVLSASGVGLPFLKAGLIGLAATFLLTTNKAGSLVDKLKVFGNFIEGIVQLVSSLNTETGLSKIDKDIKDILEKNGIWTLAQNIARAVSVIQSVLKQAMATFLDFKDGVMSVLNPVINVIKNLLGFNGGPWSKGLVDGTSTLTKGLGKGLAVAGSLYLALKAIKGLRGLLSGIPIIGKFFGGGSSGLSGKGGPSGTAADPIYTKDASTSNAVTGALKEFGLLKLLSGFGSKVGNNVGLGKKMLELIVKSAPATGAEAVGTGVGVISTMKFMTDIFSSIPKVFAALDVGLGGLLLLGSQFVAIAGAAYAGYKGGEFLLKQSKGTGVGKAIDSVMDPSVGFIGNMLNLQGSDRWLDQQMAMENFKGALVRRHSQAAEDPYNYFGLDDKTPKMLSINALNDISLGLDPASHKVASVPAIPSDTPHQLRLLSSTRASVDSSEKDIFSKAITELSNALLNNMDPEETAKMTEQAYIRAMQKTKEPDHTASKSRRGGC